MPAPNELVVDLRRRFDEAEPSCVLQAVLGEVFTNRIAIVSSFGADSGVLLHLAAEIDPAVPVLFVDTGRHFPETLDHRDRLVERLGLRDVRTVGPSKGDVERLDVGLDRATWDPDGCCAFRKVAPLEQSLSGFDAWITGRKRFQAPTRHELAVFEIDGARAKINPLARWSQARIDAYVALHDLPAHPLAAHGYPSIGCAPCTSAVAPGEDARAGRWRNSDKTECGIHRPASPVLQPAK